MRSFYSCLASLVVFIGGCNDTLTNEDVGVAQEPVISVTNADKLINDGRAQLGTYGGQCKAWVQNVTSSSYSATIPTTDTSPETDQYKWTNETTPATKVAQWIGYCNGRTGPIALSAGQTMSPTVTVVVPNADPQSLVLYASGNKVTATITKGSTTLSVTSNGTSGGTVSSNTVSGAGNWTLSIKNNATSGVTGVVAAVLSRSRFQSDWQTARRGDIMQMYVGTSASNRSIAHPHTVFVQTNYNANGSTTCGSTDTTGCNWLDSNWSPDLDGIVRAHNITMEQMMLMSAYSSTYAFTVYRLN